MQRPSQSQVQCAIHKELYTNFCLNIKCLTPLCPECITSHTTGAHTAQITSIRECSQQCIQKLKLLLEHVQRLNQHPELQTAYNIETLLNESELNLNILKEKMIYRVESYFHQLIGQMKSEIITISKNPFIMELHQKLTNIAAQLSQLTRQVTVPDRNQIEAFKTVLTLDEELLMQKTNFETQKLLEDILSVISNLEEQWEKLMKEFISIDIERPTITSLLSNIRLPSEQQSIIKRPDYFDKQCFNRCLHYFKYNSNELYTCPIGQNTFEKLVLKSALKTPVFHSSAITPNGLIYMLGGSIPNQNYPKQKSDCIYQYEWGKMTLKRVGTMIRGRSSFGCCVKGQYIYSIAGLVSDSEETQICERFDTQTHKSQVIADCLHGAVAPACVEMGDHVYKISELHIERYSTEDGLWQLVDPNVIVRNSPFKGLCQYACAAQISSTELIIFGGYLDDVGQDSVYSLQRLNELTPTLRQLEIAMPCAEGFWTSQAIVHQRSIYVLQNNESSEEVMADTRRILRYNGVWETLN